MWKAIQTVEIFDKENINVQSLGDGIEPVLKKVKEL